MLSSSYAHLPYGSPILIGKKPDGARGVGLLSLPVAHEGRVKEEVAAVDRHRDLVVGNAYVGRAPCSLIACRKTLAVAGKRMPVCIACKPGAELVVKGEHRHGVNVDGQRAFSKPVEGEIKVFQLFIHVPVASCPHLRWSACSKVIASCRATMVNGIEHIVNGCAYALLVIMVYERLLRSLRPPLT